MQNSSQLINETVNETRTKTVRTRRKGQAPKANKPITRFIDEMILRSAEETLKFFK